MRLRSVDLPLEDRVQIMGILNVTPDSFSDGGLYHQLDQAVERALEMEADGADLIDIGGESTRPGATLITAAEEMARVLPVIEKLAEAYGVWGATVTKRSEVAEVVTAARRERGALIDFRVEQEDTVYPMVPAGKDLDKMIRRPSPIVETAKD